LFPDISIIILTVQNGAYARKNAAFVIMNDLNMMTQWKIILDENKRRNLTGQRYDKSKLLFEIEIWRDDCPSSTKS
jgi:hypothetical protein